MLTAHLQATEDYGLTQDGPLIGALREIWSITANQSNTQNVVIDF